MKVNEYSVDLEDVKKMLELYSKLKDTDIFKEFYEEELKPIKIESLQMLIFYFYSMDIMLSFLIHILRGEANGVSGNILTLIEKRRTIKHR
ncbi:hypothetical protein PDJ99_25515 [Bacillus cereus]|nr:hypothetical protein [Bacillus cereus]